MRLISGLLARWLLRRADRDLVAAGALRETADAHQRRAERRMARAARLLAGRSGPAPRPAPRAGMALGALAALRGWRTA